MGQRKPEVTSIYTDGACSGNPGPGGWGAIAYLSNGQVHEIGGAARGTTNNRMELQAAIEILEWLQSSPQLTPPILYTDSKYVQNGINSWIKGWKKKQWKTSAGKPVLNQDLWQRLDAANQAVNANFDRPLRWEYVKGHAGHAGNERCDAIARGFAQGSPPRLATVAPWDQLETDSSAPSTPTTARSHALDVAPEEQSVNSTQGSVTNGSSPNGSSINASDSNGTNALPPAKNDTIESTRMVDTSQTTLQQIIERLRVADELATHGYWVTSAELAHVVELSPSTINSKGDRWLWRNWSIVRVNPESSPILWQLSRID